MVFQTGNTNEIKKKKKNKTFSCDTKVLFRIVWFAQWVIAYFLSS